VTDVAPNQSETDRPFAADPAVSFTLPARYYTSPELFQAEKSAIFEQSWFYVGHQSQLRETGSYLTATVFDQEVFATSTASTTSASIEATNSYREPGRRRSSRVHITRGSIRSMARFVTPETPAR